MILVIDSEKIPDMQIRQSFEQLGMQSVQITKTAEQARQFIKSSEEDKKSNITLIVINSELEDADGFEFCRELKKTETGQQAYILMIVSSAENKTAIEKSRHSGASYFAVKPYQSAGFTGGFIKYMSSRVVLLVEDDPVVCQMVKAILAKAKLEVIEVNDGVQASNLLNNLLPTCFVLLDIGLPNMNGIQLVKKIRNIAIWRKTPVLMMTGSTDASDVKSSLSSGANDYIVKPFKPSELNTRLSKYLPDGG